MVKNAVMNKKMKTKIEKRMAGYYVSKAIADAFDNDIEELFADQPNISRGFVAERLMQFWLDSPVEGKRKIVNPLPEANSFADYLNGVVDQRIQQGFRDGLYGESSQQSNPRRKLGQKG